MWDGCGTGVGKGMPLIKGGRKHKLVIAGEEERKPKFVYRINMTNDDDGSSVTLILYALDEHWWKGNEPLLNLIAAAAQFSTFTHIEISIGEDSGARGEMANVLRVFNDATGVELCQRTGKNPHYQYISLGCTKKAEKAMLHFARNQIGKPFSSTGMARSLIWPRKTDYKSWYCAELVAACLQAGGLMSRDSKPGAATPHSLYKMYKQTGAIQANMCTVRQQLGHFGVGGMGGMGGMGGVTRTRKLYSSVPQCADDGAPYNEDVQSGGKGNGKGVKTNAMPPTRFFGDNSRSGRDGREGNSGRASSPPRANFRVVQARGSELFNSSNNPMNEKIATLNTISLSLSSLKVDPKK